ncbi:hypothetical protein Q9314_28300 (plasmid) [Shinella sumterensis]|uniref:hypothetical protein n=1 Tax=Shinella sp. TaxID=1870904 RepID=UPI00273DEAC1|nr:hypothetical protein [Shinella sp.]WLS11932.1 hypothetical protein Q9314_28300 [Shinella sumterensis]
MKYRLISALLLTAPSAWAADNPMWRSGFTWSCTFSSVIRCERSTDCVSSGQGGKIQIAYRENQVVDPEGKTQSIRRHYVQTVAGSPIGSEVKIELDTNEVIWLSPADAAGTFSDNWIGVLSSPKSGVTLQELRPLICTPQK